jgi:xanthine dehydrogenase accessory factor
MRTILPKMLACLEKNIPAAYCRLVETRGSTPQKAGAAMLIYANGQQAGTLGGGCVEAEVRRRAMAAIVGRLPEVASFQLNHDYGWDDGLICGGRMQAVIEPLSADRHAAYFRRLDSLFSSCQPAVEAIGFESDDSSCPLPFHILFSDRQEVLATVPDLLAEAHVRQIAEQVRPLHGHAGPYAEKGTAFLPISARCQLLIVGGGHVGKAVADLAEQLDFDIWIVEDREEFASQDRFPYARRRIIGDFDRVLRDVEVTPDTYCLIVTRGHNHDARALYHLARRGARYVGLIGSRRKIRVIFEDLLQQGIPAEALERVFAPVGLDIGSQTVNEIAVSIAAELIAHRNQAGQVPARPAGVAVRQPK